MARIVSCAVSIVFAVMVCGCNESTVRSEDPPQAPLFERLGMPDQIWYGSSNSDEVPVFFSNKFQPSRWQMCSYIVDGWMIRVTLKDNQIVEMSTDNIAEAERRARDSNDPKLKVLRERLQGIQSERDEE